jgi:hypothetical protein
MDIEANAKILCELFKSDKPFLIGRNGTIELDVVSRYFFKEHIPDEQKKKLELHAGVFPQNHVDDYCFEYLRSLMNADVMAEGWYAPLKMIEQDILDIINKKRTKILLRNLEPYYVKPELRWTQYLGGRRVAIINSFAKICEEQTYMPKAIWGEQSESLLPKTTQWIPIQTYYSPALANGKATTEWPAHISSWKEAVDDVVNRVLTEAVDVAIIGCGGMGMIIGSRLKDHGIQCIVMGGSTQLLFGIRGKRWENHDVISKFFNDAWVTPSDWYRPANYKTIEGGCYW